MQISTAIILFLVAPAFATSVDLKTHCNQANVRFVTIDLPLDTVVTDGKGIADCNDGKCLLDQTSYDGCVNTNGHVDILAKVSKDRHGGYTYIDLSSAYLTPTGDMKEYDGINFYITDMSDSELSTFLNSQASSKKLVVTVPVSKYTLTLKTEIEADLDNSSGKIKHVFIENGDKADLPTISTTKKEKVTILTTLKGTAMTDLANKDTAFKVAYYNPEDEVLTSGFSNNLDICKTQSSTTGSA